MWEIAMEIVLEFEDVKRLLRKALETEGIRIPDDARCLVRQNHKERTIRVVFSTRDTRRRPKR